jgi:hypothetical protein
LFPWFGLGDRGFARGRRGWQSHDPESGLPAKRLISGGFLMLKGEEAVAGCESGACEMPKPSHSCGTGCGCFAGN